jgi:sugar lactone lactonase YvrE
MIGRQGGAGDGGPATRAELFLPFGVALDKDGNLYIAEGPANRGRIRKVTPDGVIQTIAGNGQKLDDGVPALEADLGRLRHIVVDEAGNLYLVESSRNRVRKISPEGTITTVAGKGTPGLSGDGGPATEAELRNPVGLALDRTNTLYIADAGNGRVRTVAADGTISTLVQFEVTAAGTPASMGVIQAVTLDAAGALYVAHQNQVHRMPAAEPVVDAPIAGGNTTRGQDDVPATESVVWSPAAVITDPAGNLYIAEPENYRIRLVTPDGNIRTFAGGAPGFSGDGGPAVEAQLMSPRGLAADKEGNIYIADLGAARVRMVSAASGLIATVAGDGRRVSDGDGGPAHQAGLMYPQYIAVDGRGNLYIADSQAHRVRKVTPDGIISTFAGDGRQGFSGDGGPAAEAALNRPSCLTADATGNVYFLDNLAMRLRRVAPDGIITSISVPFFVDSTNFLTGAVGLAIDSTGRPVLAYAAQVLRAQTDAVFTRIAGDGVFGWSGDGGPATQARFANLSGLWVDASGAILLADTANHRIRKLTPDTQP